MKSFLIIVSTVFFLAGGLFVAIVIYSPKQTVFSAHDKQVALQKLLGRNPIITENIRPTGTIGYDGKYVSFLYPAAAQDYSYNDNNVKGSTFVLESKEFKESNPLYHFIVQVIKQSDQIKIYDDVPSIHLRRTQTDKYQESPILIGQEQGVAFISESEGYEKDAFLLHNGLLYSFVITGGNAKIEKIHTQVVKSAAFSPVVTQQIIQQPNQ